MFSLLNLRQIKEEEIVEVCEKISEIKETLKQLDNDYSKDWHLTLLGEEENEYINLNIELEYLIESLIVSLGNLNIKITQDRNCKISESVYSVLGNEGCQEIREYGFDIVREYGIENNHYIKFIKISRLVEDDKLIQMDVKLDCGRYECKFRLSDMQELKDKELVVDLDKVYAEISEKINNMTAEEVNHLNNALKKSYKGGN